MEGIHNHSEGIMQNSQDTAVGRFNEYWQSVGTPEAQGRRDAERAEYEERYEAMRARNYGRTFDNLRVCSLNQEQHERTCGYWYTVTTGAMAHTAFATRAGLDRWLAERGLELVSELPATGEWGVSAIAGSYRRLSHLDTDEFEAISPLIVTPVMDNAAYTLGLITEDEDGIRTVHHLNRNVKSRMVFDYKITQEQVS